MLALGIFLLLIGSVIRGWGILNHRRGPIDAPEVATGSVLAFLGILSIILGLSGTIMIGSQTSLWGGLISLGGFWLLSKIWPPILASLGL